MHVVPPLDLPRDPSAAREALEQRLASLRDDEAVLVRARHDPRPLVGFQAWPVVDGPAAWHLLVHRERPAPPPDPEAAAAREGWAAVFRLYREAMGRGDGGPAFARALEAELRREEERLFPRWRAATGDERAPRELGYEIAGIRKGLLRLDEILQGVREGTLTKRERDRYDIDFFHLVEHHVERLERSLLPVLDLLGQGI